MPQLLLKRRWILVAKTRPGLVTATGQLEPEGQAPCHKAVVKVGLEDSGVQEEDQNSSFTVEKCDRHQ
ncbi:hypothetical protein CapIbe_008794 [Capra ibex]